MNDNFHMFWVGPVLYINQGGHDIMCINEILFVEQWDFEIEYEDGTDDGWKHTRITYKNGSVQKLHGHHANYFWYMLSLVASKVAEKKP